MPAANTMFVRVSIKKSPISANVVAFQLAVHTHKAFTNNSALHYMQLPLNTTLKQLNVKIDALRKQTNTQFLDYVQFPFAVTRLLAANSK